MRILLVRDRFTSASPPVLTRFITQLVRQAAADGHELRELVPNRTGDDKGFDENRTAVRVLLDQEVAVFDPQVIHVQGIGVLGHLALETGVPYVISAFNQDLTIGQIGSSVRSFSQQAVENAGGVLVDSEETRRRVLAGFGELEAVVVVEEMADPDAPGSLERLWQLYNKIVAARRGQ